MAALSQILEQQIKGPESINQVLLVSEPVDKKTSQMMYSDKFYGLNKANPTLAFYWQPFLNEDDNDGNVSAAERLVWQWELRTYFGLSYTQINELEENLQKLYREALEEIETKFKGQDLTFAQWATGSVTQKVFGKASVKQIQDSSLLSYET